MVSRFGLDLRFEHVEAIAVVVEDLRPTLGDFPKGFSFFLGTLDSLVVDIREVPDVYHLEARNLKSASDNVLGKKGAEIPDVGLGVNGGTAAIHSENIAFK